jgi:exosortase A
MPPDLALRGPALRSPIPAAWRTPLAQLALAWAGLIALFHGDWAVMADQWWNSSTYNHILLVPLILGWLAWQRAGEVARLTPGAWWPGLIVLAGALFVWLLGAVSGLNLARHLGLVVALQAALVTLLGPRVSTAMLFPLAYMLALVPFGDELVPALQLITAELTIGLTHLSGIPAVIEGVFIDTPAGLFEVAEACSGVKFLVAMVALGALVANLGFRSWARRAAFMTAAVVLPILANGVRAWGTIYIAQFAGLEFAASFDHVIYGWLFFAVVMGMLLALAWRYFDRALDDPYVDAAAIEASPVLAKAARWSTNAWTALAIAAVLAIGAQSWAHAAERLAAPIPETITLPAVAGWQLVPVTAEYWWEPRAAGADHRLLGRYRDAAGREVDVFYALYRSQDEGREAGAFGEGALVPHSDWRWLEPGPAIAGGSGAWLLAGGKTKRLAVTYYRTGDTLTGSNSRLKLANMRDRLVLAAHPTSALILTAEARPGHDAASDVAAFAAAVGEPGAWMDAIARGS